MHVFHATLIWMAAAGVLAVQVPAQTQNAAEPTATPAAMTAATTASGSTPGAAPVTASSLIGPALGETRAMLGELRLEKWKKGDVRDEAEGNIRSLLGDMETQVAPLMAAADGAPGLLSKTIPLVKHIDAFYAVLLRVEEASRVSAPPDQISAIEQSLHDVNKARLALEDQLAAVAVGQEKQIGDLRAQVKTLMTPPPEPRPAVVEPATCKPAPAPARKKNPAAKKPANPAPAANPPEAFLTSSPRRLGLRERCGTGGIGVTVSIFGVGLLIRGLLSGASFADGGAE
jgi:hypothetical protein